MNEKLIVDLENMLLFIRFKRTMIRHKISFRWFVLKLSLIKS